MDFTQGSLHQYVGTLWRTILSKPKILHQYFGALLRTILPKPKVLRQHLGALLRTVQNPSPLLHLDACASKLCQGCDKRKYMEFPVYFSVIQDCHQPWRHNLWPWEKTQNTFCSCEFYPNSASSNDDVGLQVTMFPLNEDFCSDMMQTTWFSISSSLSFIVSRMVRTSALASLCWSISFVQ